MDMDWIGYDCNRDDKDRCVEPEASSAKMYTIQDLLTQLWDFESR